MTKKPATKLQKPAPAKSSKTLAVSTRLKGGTLGPRGRNV
jgi:hypothetical protein